METEGDGGERVAKKALDHRCKGKVKGRLSEHVQHFTYVGRFCRINNVT